MADNKAIVSRRRHATSSTKIYIVFSQEPEIVKDKEGKPVLTDKALVDKFPERPVAYNAAACVAKKGSGCAWIVHWDNDDPNMTIEEVRYGAASYKGMLKEPQNPK